MEIGSVYGKLTVKSPARLAPGEWICSCTCGTLRSYTEFDIEMVSHCGCKRRPERSKKYMVNGELLTARQIETQHGILHQTFYARIKMGWDPSVAATKPAAIHLSKPEKVTHKNVTTEYLGKTMSMKELFQYSHVSYTLMYYRICAGWPAADAIKPVQRPINVKQEFHGKLLTMREISDLTGINYNTITSRMADGLTLEEAADPNRKRTRRKKHEIAAARLKKAALRSTVCPGP